MPTDLSASRSSTSSPSSSSAASPHGGVHRPGDEREKGTPPGPGGKRRRRLAAIGPRARWAREWDRAYLLACAAGLMVDPLFLYAVSVSGPLMCVFLDGWFAAAVTALRCMVDALHAWNLLLRLRTACAPGEEKEEDDADADEEAQRVGGGAAPARLPRSKKGGLLLDVFVILPVMQVVMWVGIPAMIRAGSTTSVMTVLMVAFLFEYLPKIYHSVRFLRRMQNVAGYIFGTIWWGIALNLMAYFVAAHAVGACWYLLGAQRATKCLREQYCAGRVGGCAAGALACAEPLYYGGAGRLGGGAGADRLAWARNASARATCLDSGDNYQYGAYKWTVMLVANPSRLEKILLPIFWGLMTLSTFGNLASTTEWSEIVFNIITITGGLILVTMLIGNIKVFLNATTSKKQAMHTRLRSVEWWMKRKNLPQSFRHRVRQQERQRWAATRGVDECRIVRDLPEGLRRDIKYHLCLDLVRQVPLFHHMDDLVLENICDRVKSLVFPKGEVIVREGDPVQRMLFIVRGHLQSSQVLRNGGTSCCMLGPGNFSGDELLSWCLRRPFRERLPAASSTLVTLESTEAFGLEAADVKYVTQHFRYTFANEKVRRSARYYSHGWRTWAAVAVQLAWRRYRHRKTLTSLSFIRPRRPLSRCSSLGEEKLRLYTALLTSPKPNQDDLLL
ncbi:cyclic nucleotide-gated ion channel 4-like [Triticum urartu]|uniref:Cyclic nucleotide-binding domain-containing protein n=1 Tax=Triticum urartu TaxID=4572 RepID=A0A8R7JYC2_TRIUA|nr:cyclic nucleotide-gated ion channel 4-like [Triticum urartu]XP_048573480.1 cyclic nucleotide-gated ion channel 4-like [Triticum urartu]